MAVYIDPLRSFPHKRKQYAHMVADSVEELHSFAEFLCIKRHWFHNNHYDIREIEWNHAVIAGAIVVTSRDIVRLRSVMRK